MHVCFRKFYKAKLLHEHVRYYLISGEIRLRRNISELLGIAKPNEPIRMTIIAEEIVQENGRFGKSLNPTLERTMGNITFWFGRGNSLGPPAFSSDK